MTVHESLLRDILMVGHETSIRGAGLSLRDALIRTRYKDLRDAFGAEDLVGIVENDQSLAEQWFAYSEDKRTMGGWYIRRDGEIGQVGKPESQVRFEPIEKAVAEYVVRELDFWAGVGEAG